MRSPNFWGMAVRTPSGDMDLRAERFHSVTRRSKLFRLPIIRGALSLGETLWLGMKALTISTNLALGEEQELSKKEIAGTLIFALVLGFGLFLVAPVLGTKGLGSFLGNSIENPVIFNLVEGFIRIAIFIAYLLVITLLSKDIKRFFAYHGAEHKAIKVYERGEEEEPETEHQREDEGACNLLLGEFLLLAERNVRGYGERFHSQPQGLSQREGAPDNGEAE